MKVTFFYLKKSGLLNLHIIFQVQIGTGSWFLSEAYPQLSLVGSIVEICRTTASSTRSWVLLRQCWEFALPLPTPMTKERWERYALFPKKIALSLTKKSDLLEKLMSEFRTLFSVHLKRVLYSRLYTCCLIFRIILLIYCILVKALFPEQSRILFFSFFENKQVEAWKD